MTRPVPTRRIFTFWEPRGAVTPYLQCCRETWERGTGGHEVVTLDYANLEEFIGADTLDLDALRKVRLSVQKDAIMVAVLLRHGGLFIDLDTIVVGDLEPVLAKLDAAPLVTFGRPLAVTAARKGDALIAEWLEAVQANLAKLRDGSISPGVPWWFLGNGPLADVLRRRRDRRFPFSILARLRQPAPTGRRRGLFEAVLNRIETALDRAAPGAPWHRIDNPGFLPELIGVPASGRNLEREYLRFWFEPGEVAPALIPGTSVVALRNSWTPAWYQALSRDAVLAHDCRLSAVLRHLLRG